MPTTRTANSTPTSTPNLHQTPSRLPEHDPPFIPNQDLASSHSFHQGRPLLPQDVSTSRPPKRRRPSRHPNMTAERASSSSDVSSQSGMADNETEPEPSQLSEPSTTRIAAPPKKKRTRTLTTPQQSAVLHALLAKSRFPTTAMREEVGRQIGLSARKVQIWFQNQRQKARRPQGESGPLTRPPQFGPFPIMGPTGAPLTSYPSPPAGGPSSEALHSSARSQGSLDSPSLSGPAMPGWSSSFYQRGHSEEWDPPRRAPASPDAPLSLAPHGISPRDSRGNPRGLAPHPAHAEASPPFSRILPPIHLGAVPEPRVSAESPRSSFSSQPPLTFVNTVLRPDPGVRFAPSSVVEPSSPVRIGMGIPPPFALQPQPQWDRHAFSPFTRPEFASWSHASGSTLSLGSVRSSSFSADHVSPLAGRASLPPGQERRGPDPPPISHPHHLIPSSRQRHSDAGASFRGSASGRGHARSDDEGGET